MPASKRSADIDGEQRSPAPAGDRAPDYPQLYSFITCRAERIGGYLFNPYLQRELPITEWELAVAQLCDGRHTEQEMADLLAPAFRCGRAAAEAQVAAALERIAGHMALRRRAGVEPPPSAAPRPAGECRFPSADQTAEGCLAAPLSILWEVTHACNLACRHCLSACGEPHPRELTTAEALALIDDMARLRIFTVTLGGGEPLMRPDLWLLLERITGHGMCARLSTNGWAVTPETIRRLEGLNVFTVQVSVDGPAAVHDRLRGRPGSFERATGALRLFREAGCATMMTTAASAANLGEAAALLRLAAELGVTAYKMASSVPLGRAKRNRAWLGLGPREVRYLAMEVAEQARALGVEEMLQVDGLYPWLLDPEPDGGPADVPPGPGCSAGVSELVVSYDGRVFPCPYMRRTVVGDLRRTDLEEIWQRGPGLAALREFDARQIEGRCGSCGHLGRSCHGGCRGAALAAHGRLYGADPFCWAHL